MASFAAQAALRVKWSSLVEDHGIEVPQEVTNKVTSVVGWLKQASLEVKAAGLRAVNKLSENATMANENQLIILHYNDVYNVESRPVEPVGGAARFLTAIKRFEHLNPLVLFSGDAFSPSMLSTFTKGEQMVPVLNEVGTHCAVFGNHDFDHGLDVLAQWVPKCNFPWLMSNVLDNETGRPLGEGKITHMIVWNGRRIGLIGLVEKEWLDTLSTINPDEVTFLDFNEAGEKLAQQLRQEGCDFIIALTHMRTPNDIKLAESCQNIDLILGGHDHVFETHLINDKYIVKSGTDFRQFSKITVNFEKNSHDIKIEEVNVTQSFAEDSNLKEVLDGYSAVIEKRMDEVLGCFTVPLEGRFQAVRTSESNLGNWICDVVLAATGADLVLLNSGTLRSDQVHPAGDFTMRDLVSILPMHDPVVLIAITGKQVLDMLENGVSQYPKLEGRFPQVAGVSFAFEPSQPPGKRVDPNFVRIGDEYLNLEQVYRLATKSYVHSGCDGYVMLRDSKVLVAEDECPSLGLAIQNHFQAINMRLGKTRRHSKHRQSLVTLSRRHSLVKMLDGADLDGPPPLRKSSTTETPMHAPHNKLTRRASLDDLEDNTCTLTPKLDNRIIIINNPEKKHELILQRKRLEENSVIEEVDDENSPQY